MPENSIFVIVTGTDPESRKGGIGFALPGYLSAMSRAGLRYISIPTYHPAAQGGSWWWWLRSFPKLWHHIFTARQEGAKVMVYSHAGAGFSLAREAAVLAFCRLLGAKTILQLHALEIDGYATHPLKRILFRVAILPANAVSVLTPWWRSKLVQSGIDKRLFVIPNPLPSAWEEKALAKGRSARTASEAIIVLAIARIEPGKGVDLIIEAMPLLPEYVELIVGGEGSQLESLKLRARKLGVEHRVSFAGWVSGDEKQRLIEKADVFCLPSSYDSFGMGFLEAMANGLPVVALDWGPIPDVVNNGNCGLLIKDNKPELLAEAILSLRDPGLRQTIGENARRWVAQQFGSEHVGKAIRAMINDLI